MKAFLLLGEGRNNDEFSVVKIINGVYKGFSFIDQSTQLEQLDRNS